MRIAGLLAGLGTMLHEGRVLGWDVLGNIESRPVFHRQPWWTWNFGDLPFGAELTAELKNALSGADIAIGHPPCGAHSVLGESRVSLDLSASERSHRQTRRASRVGLLPLFAELVRQTKPTMFALDNLPKILRTVGTMEWWASQLPDYHLSHFIMVNGHYGSLQRRQRLWICGTRKRRIRKPFILAPIQTKIHGPANTMEALEGLPWEPWINDHDLAHVHLPIEAYPLGGFRLGDKRTTHLVPHAGLVALQYLSRPAKHPWCYHTWSSNRVTNKVGWIRADPLGTVRVLSGFPSVMHPMTGWPLTPRERARLMGWPDDFRLSDGQRMTTSMFSTLSMVTGRGVPSEFLRYLLPQMADHLKRSKR